MSPTDPKRTSTHFRFDHFRGKKSLSLSWIARRLIFGLRFFAKSFDVGFGLLRCLIDVFANFGNAFLFTRWLNVDDKALLVR
jgi:hypothetical protein